MVILKTYKSEKSIALKLYKSAKNIIIKTLYKTLLIWKKNS